MRYQIRQLGLGGILDQTFTLIKDHLGMLLAITGVLLIPYQAISGLVQVMFMPQLPPNPTLDQLKAFQGSTGNLWIILPVQLLGVLVVPITNAALAYAVANAYLDKPISLGSAYGKALRRFFPLIWTWFLLALAVIGGLILCFVPGILAAFWFTLATQIVVIEDLSGPAALKRSKLLMTGNIGTFFALSLLLGIINTGLTVSMLAIPQPHARMIVLAILTGIETILSSVALVVFYFSCRCKHENFDLALLAESVGEKPPAEPMIGDPELQW